MSWKQMKPRVLIILAQCVMVACAGNCVASFFTVKDIVEAIDARQTKISDIELQYSVFRKNEDAFYDRINQDYEIAKAHASEGQRVELPVPDGHRLDPNFTSVFHIFAKGNKKAFETFDVDPVENARIATSKAVYDGEVFKYLNVEELNGSVERRLPNQVIQFPTIPKMLGLEGVDFCEYLKKEDVESRITKEETINGDLIIELVIDRSYLPSADSPVEIITEHVVKLNASKDFWPIKIDQYGVVKNFETGQSVRSLRQTTEVSEFTESNGLYYPKTFKSEAYDYDYSYEDDKYIPTLSNQKTMHKAEVETEILRVNTDLPDDVFSFDFPDGTRYHDAITGMGMIVGADPEKLADFMVKTADGLPTDVFTESQAREILTLRRQGRYQEADRLRDDILNKNASAGPRPVSSLPRKTAVPSKSPDATDKVAVTAEYRRVLFPRRYIPVLVFLFCAGFTATLLIMRKWKKIKC